MANEATMAALVIEARGQRRNLVLLKRRHQWAVSGMAIPYRLTMHERGHPSFNLNLTRNLKLVVLCRYGRHCAAGNQIFLHALQHPAWGCQAPGPSRQHREPDTCVPAEAEDWRSPTQSVCQRVWGSTVQLPSCSGREDAIFATRAFGTCSDGERQVG